MNSKRLENIILNDNEKDDRLKILENGMTKYGCKPIFYPHMSYSSCTASTISIESFMHVQEYYSKINLDNLDNYIEEFQNIRDDLRKIIGLKDEVDIVLGPSGTDLEMIPYMFIPKNAKVKNIIIGPDEVGSGTLLATKGRIFSNMGKEYQFKKGDQIEGFENYNIDLVSLPVRNDNGKPFNDGFFLDKINEILKDKNTYKIIHSVFHSKTGLIKPSPEKLLNLNLDEKTIIVIDACQFRISREKINYLLDKGCIVFITGSKFFGGPTFSAAALIPESLRDIVSSKQTDTIRGLNILFDREFFPKRWKSIDGFSYGNNLGLLLRNRVAIFEMQLFTSISKNRIKSSIKLFNKVVKSLFEEYREFRIYSDILDTEDYDLLMSNSILTFGFKDKNIDIEQAKIIYQTLISRNWLNEEFSYPVHLGQPVKIIKENNRFLGTLRIALSARFFVNYSGKVQEVQEQMIYQELKYILNAIKIIKESI